MTNPTPEAIEELVKRLQALLDADPDTKIFDIRRTDLADMLTALSQRQRVKPLVWGSDGRSGEYIVWSLHSDCWLVTVGAHVMGGILYGAYQRKFKTIDAAKAAAQADYEAHILSALEPDPTGGWCSDMEAAEDQFSEWFRKNYPGPDTIIHKPDWHAPKIFRAACAVLRITPPVRGQEKGGA